LGGERGFTRDSLSLEGPPTPLNGRGNKIRLRKGGEKRNHSVNVHVSVRGSTTRAKKLMEKKYTNATLRKKCLFGRKATGNKGRGTDSTFTLAWVLGKSNSERLRRRPRSQKERWLEKRKLKH